MLFHARNAAGRIGIPHYFLDYEEDFRRLVLSKAWEEYRQGRTPNPCVLCNKYLKFGKLFDYAKEVGADGVATGHYAQILPVGDGGVGLFRGLTLQRIRVISSSIFRKKTLPDAGSPSEG